MNQGAAGAFGGIYLAVVLFLVVLAILWFFLPFAIFGTKAKLDLLIQEMKRTNMKLEQLQEQFADAGQSIPHAREDAPRKIKLTHDEAMEKYSLKHDGEKYVFQGHRYDKIEDAIAYASSQAQDGYLY